ncbi:MAG: hypothetical protein SFY81_04795 [Verrucomicrobiota bacterium]|nr:hypothetical protein [Verrucomicrobiota bacterium]
MTPEATIAELLDTVLNAIRNQWYSDQPREFLRDRQALMKAVARYGYECHQRGWEFEAQAILHAIMKLLNEIKASNAVIEYLPLYLDGAIGRHLSQRADKLNAEAKKLKPKIAKLVQGVRIVEAVREASHTEILANVYSSLKTIQRRNRTASKATRKTAQKELF